MMYHAEIYPLLFDYIQKRIECYSIRDSYHMGKYKHLFIDKELYEITKWLKTTIDTYIPDTLEEVLNLYVVAKNSPSQHNDHEILEILNIPMSYGYIHQWNMLTVIAYLNTIQKIIKDVLEKYQHDCGNDLVPYSYQARYTDYHQEMIVVIEKILNGFLDGQTDYILKDKN